MGAACIDSLVGFSPDVEAEARRMLWLIAPSLKAGVSEVVYTSFLIPSSILNIILIIG